MRIGDRAKPLIPPVPGGTYLAVCVYSIDLGEQLCAFKESKSYKNQVQLGFELYGQTVEIDGKQEPRILSRTFSVSVSNKSSLRAFVSAWDGKQYSDDEFNNFDTNMLVGRTAMLSVVLSEDGAYANIASALQIPAGFQQPTATTPLIRFDIEPWDQPSFDALPEWAQEKVKKSTQYQKMHAPNTVITTGTTAPAAAPTAVPVTAAPVMASAPVMTASLPPVAAPAAAYGAGMPGYAAMPIYGVQDAPAQSAAAVQNGACPI